MKEEKRETVWTVANFFSLLRILLTPLFLYMLIHQEVLYALVVFFVASSTDLLDGMAARMWNQKTKIGGLLDPAADKLLMAASIIVLSIKSVSQPNTIPLWLTIIIISRDLAITTSALVLYKRIGQKRFPPSAWGKASTVCQMGIVFLVLLFNVLQTAPSFMTWLYVLTLFFTFVSGVQYGRWGYRLLSQPHSKARNF
jgi:CDP-diacylglycerol--glycerol-3-phosphate 3-phosphatidyltransferase